MTLPAWSGAFAADHLTDVRALPLPGPAQDWAWGGSTGAGVRVAIVDSGVEDGHPRVGRLAGAVSVEPDPDDPSRFTYVEGPHEDLVGHGTACGGIIRSLAPDVEIYSVRVLGANLRGKGSAFLAGVRWALDQGIQVVNMSLSSRSEQWFGPLHQVADEAYFKGSVLVCAANNVPGPTYPSQYAAVISVAARPGDDPYAVAYNPHPPVEFGARGIDVDVAWSGGGSMVSTGNSFATPHIAGLVALMLAKHPWLTPFQIKTVLQAVAENASPLGDETMRARAEAPNASREV
ncbi:MAG TPA: S8 family serine peptidase [Nocardioidaceae bacterium]|nr:S8 family serine peptidase [Nocardioidaceae bacterium]